MIVGRTVDYVLAVTRTGNFAQAADACHVSQPSLSVQIKKLEGFLGARLFTRTKRGAVLTAFGQEVLPKLEALKDLETEIRTQIAGKAQAQTLRIGAIPTLAPSIFPDLMKQDAVEVSEGTTVSLIQAISENQIDAGFVALPVAIPGMSTVSLFFEPFMLASSSELPPVDPIGLEGLSPDADRRLVVLSSEHCAGDQALQLCNANRGQQNRFLEATSLETARSMVAASANFTLIPKLNQRQGDNLIYQSSVSYTHLTLPTIA